MSEKTTTSQKVQREIQREYMTEQEVELLTGIKAKTLQKYRLFNKGPKYYKGVGGVRYKISEVREWFESHVAGGEGVERVG